MKFTNQLYYCTECKCLLPSLDKLLFVEENSTKGFCSEDCIEDFHQNLIGYFEKVETSIRARFGIESEKIVTSKSEKQIVDEVLSGHDEVWRQCNELDEELFTYIKHFNDFSGAVICKTYNGEASFIFLSTITRSPQFLSEIRAGENISKQYQEGQGAENSEELSEGDFNFIQLLENKKSALLADLLEKRKDNDIAFEDFANYESCFTETLEAPDEVFERQDNDGDSLFVYIKSFIKSNDNVFYIISCLKRNDSEETPDVNVFPILAFPTNDLALYSEFRAGKRIAGLLKS